ncbi:E3 ubiquitin-protein ligase siah2-like [Bacillus rossius redtenbacheri]|uniref:E3 ubiquitin-protein ligase siah2-like n=1 Tax=Bacillus rossius redtenbacheri TaxID=93214 RepID=UPI002FDD166D
MDDSPTASLENLNKTLLKFLECSACRNFMKTFISQCDKGHNICPRCLPKDERCPNCKEIVQARNVALEALREMAVCPCRNAAAGCDRRLSYREEDEHSSVCPHRLYECPTRDCSWTGRRTQLLEHATREHDDLLWKSDFVYISVVRPVSVPVNTSSVQTAVGHYKEQPREEGVDVTEVIEIEDGAGEAESVDVKAGVGDEEVEDWMVEERQFQKLAGTRNGKKKIYDYVGVVKSHDELFCCFIRCDNSQKCLSIAVVCVGPTKKAKKFAYKVKFSKKCSPEMTTTSSQFTGKENAKVDKLFSSPQCVQFSFSSIHKYFFNDEIRIRIEVKEL